MLGYPPSPAVEVARPRPPLSPADKIPTSKEQEFATIHSLNTRLRSLLDRDKRENVELEKKRNSAKEAFARTKEELDMLVWSFNQSCSDQLGHKETYASTEADAMTADINNNDKLALANYLKLGKVEFLKELSDMIAKKKEKLALLESKIDDLKAIDSKSVDYITEKTASVISKTDALKHKMVENARLQASIQDLQAQKRIEEFHEQKWADRCAPYKGLDPSTYIANKETEHIRSREAELEMRFRKIFDDTVEQMLEQFQKDRHTEAEKKRQSDGTQSLGKTTEKQNLEAKTKELRSKRVQLVNEIEAEEAELARAKKELHTLEAQLRELQQHQPTVTQTLAEIGEKLKKAEVERKTFAAKADIRDKNLARLQARLKEKQEQSARDKIIEDQSLNDLKEQLQQKRQRLEEANIGLFPEISKYRGLVDVAEVKLTPNAKKQKRSTM